MNIFNKLFSTILFTLIIALSFNAGSLMAEEASSIASNNTKVKPDKPVAPGKPTTKTKKTILVPKTINVEKVNFIGFTTEYFEKLPRSGGSLGNSTITESETESSCTECDEGCSIENEEENDDDPKDPYEPEGPPEYVEPEGTSTGGGSGMPDNPQPPQNQGNVVWDPNFTRIGNMLIWRGFGWQKITDVEVMKIFVKKTVDVINKCPDSIPSLGHRVRLGIVHGANSSALNWGTTIGFGEKRALSYLSKIHLTTDLRFARVFLPERAGIVTFERVGTTGYNYSIAENGMVFSAGTTIQFFDNNSDGTFDSGDKVRMSVPGDDTWEYDFETSEPIDNTLSGYVFRLVKRTTHDGYDLAIQYNANDVTVIDASGHAYVCSFNAEKRITQIAIGGRTWSYTYSSGTVTETNNQTGISNAVTINSSDRITCDNTYNGTDSLKIDYLYDSAGLMTKATKYGIDIACTEVKNGDITTLTMTKGDITQTHEYVPSGIQSIKNGSGQELNINYNSLQLVTDVTSSTGRTWHNEYDSNGFLTKEQSPNGGQICLYYDSSNNLTKATNTINSTLTSEEIYEYDSSNRLTKIIAPNCGTTQYYLDPNGCRTKIVNPNGNISLYWYNANGQVTKAKGPFTPGNEPTESRDFTYDSFGNLLTKSNENGDTTTYAYDAGGRRTSITNQNNNTRHVYYDNLGRKTKVVKATGSDITWHYDSHNRITRIDGDAAGKIKGDYYYSNADF